MKENDLLKVLYNPPPRFLFKETLEFGNLLVQSSIFCGRSKTWQRSAGFYFIYFQTVVYRITALILESLMHLCSLMVRRLEKHLVHTRVAL